MTLTMAEQDELRRQKQLLQNYGVSNDPDGKLRKASEERVIRLSLKKDPTQ